MYNLPPPAPPLTSPPKSVDNIVTSLKSIISPSSSPKSINSNSTHSNNKNNLYNNLNTNILYNNNNHLINGTNNVVNNQLINNNLNLNPLANALPTHISNYNHGHRDSISYHNKDNSSINGNIPTSSPPSQFFNVTNIRHDHHRENSVHNSVHNTTHNSGLNSQRGSVNLNMSPNIFPSNYVSSANTPVNQSYNSRGSIVNPASSPETKSVSFNLDSFSNMVHTSNGNSGNMSGSIMADISSLSPFDGFTWNEVLLSITPKMEEINLYSNVIAKLKSIILPPLSNNLNLNNNSSDFNLSSVIKSVEIVGSVGKCTYLTGTRNIDLLLITHRSFSLPEHAEIARRVRYVLSHNKDITLVDASPFKFVLALGSDNINVDFNLGFYLDEGCSVYTTLSDQENEIYAPCSYNLSRDFCLSLPKLYRDMVMLAVYWRNSISWPNNIKFDLFII